jgi:uncharacterized protein (UPF0332 family)
LTPIAQEHIGKAREYLAKSRGQLEILHYSDEAARAACLAGFHAAQALIAERTGGLARTHRGVPARFGELTRGEQRVEPAFGQFLVDAYHLKEAADYETGPAAAVDAATARDALATARRFVDCVAALIEEGNP